MVSPDFNNCKLLGMALTIPAILDLPFAAGDWQWHSSYKGRSSIASEVAAWLVGGNKWLQVRQCHSTALRIVARIFNLLLL